MQGVGVIGSPCSNASCWFGWSKGFQSYNPAQMPSYIHLPGTQACKRQRCVVSCLA
jgi:hypothetical protein